MNIYNKVPVLILATAFTLALSGPASALAATTPSLGAAATYGVLVNTYTNTVPGTTINGDIGFTTGPAVAPAGTHTNYGSGAPYAAAGTDKSTALANLNNQACTFTFAPGAIDLATDITHGPLGVYTPGVYCASPTFPWVSLGAAGITLSGSGTYIFRINGSLTTAASSSVTLTNGASACDIFWTPVDNAIISSLGANSTFFGTLIDTVRLDIRTNVTWIGRALLFDGAVSTVVDDTITVPSGCTPPPPAPATLHVIKHVINNDGGTAAASSFTLHVVGASSMGGVSDVAGSPAAGVESPGTAYTLASGIYAVSENAFAGYTSSFSGDCDASGNVTLASGDNKTCTITNDDIAPPVVVLPVIIYPPVVPPVVVPPVVTPPVTPPVVITPTVVPLSSLPNTGHGLADELWSDTINLVIPSAIFALLCSLYLFKKRV